MKYYKSKSGYFYKVVGDKKTRISMEEYKAGCKKRAMKGGFTEEGNVELRDFDIMAKLNNGTKKEFELQNMTNKENKDLPCSILFNKNGIPHIFFDYNFSTGRYNFVIYYATYGKNLLVIKKIDKDGNISEVGLFDNGLFIMQPRMILLLCNEFLQKYNESNKNEQMTNMYNLLKTYFTKFMENKPNAFKNITGSSNTPYQRLAEEILAKFQRNQ